MTGTGLQDTLAGEEFRTIAELAEIAAMAKSPVHLAEGVLPILSDAFKSSATILYGVDHRLANPIFSQRGLPEHEVPLVKSLCTQRMGQIPADITLHQSSVILKLFPLAVEEKQLGLIGLAPSGDDYPAEPLLRRVLFLLSRSLANLLERIIYEKQLNRLNAYLNVSSLISQSLDLPDILEAVLYFSMEAMSADGASVLLLDPEKKNFRFYSTEGPAKTALVTTTFPSDRGLAGAILQSGQSEVLNDVQNDPRFYRDTDAQSGFVTRTMVAIPLIAANEKIGVLEILNKANGALFSEEDVLFLQPIAEEIAFAIRNAMLFEVVVKSYCKQRQGLNSCKDFKRPLGSWTPCVKYRRESGLLD